VNNSVLVPYFRQMEREGASGSSTTRLGIKRVVHGKQVQVSGLSTTVTLIVPFAYHGSTLVAIGEGTADVDAEWTIGDYSELTYNLQQARMRAMTKAVKSLAADVGKEMVAERASTGARRINKKVDTLLRRFNLNGLYQTAKKEELPSG